MVDQVGVTHHVKLGGEHYLIKPGTYRKVSAPLFGSRFTTGDPDYNTLSFWQHWVQSCWIGGIGAEEWQDDAMYDEAVGVDTSQHEVAVLSRDLGPSDRTTGNWDLDGDEAIKVFTVFNNKLYALQVPGSGGSAGVLSKLYRLDNATDTWVKVKDFTEQVSWMTPFGGYLVFGDAGTTMNRMDTSEVFTTFDKPSGETAIAYWLQEYRGHLYTAFGRDIYRLKSDFTWDGATAFYTAEGVDYINQMEVHLGYLWMASSNGHILRTDGNNTFDMWVFPPHVDIWSIRSFDGKLWIAAGDAIDGTTAEEGILYQFTGSAVTEAKRWGRVGVDCTPGKLRVIGHRMMWGASALGGMGDYNGFGVFVYDPVEDALSMQCSNQDGAAYPAGTDNVWQAVDDVAYYRGYIYASVRKYGIFRTKWHFRDLTRELATYDTTAAGATVGALNGGWLTSSDFDAGTPGLEKLWNAITVHADLPDASCSVFMEYSTDGGVTWATAGSVTKTGVATRYRTTLKLKDAADDPVTAPRLKWRMTLRTTNTNYSPQVRAVHVQYLPLPEPNWQWHMTLVCSEQQELLDGSIQTVDASAKIDALEALYRAQIPFYFQDVDGTEWVDEGGTDVPGVLMVAFDKRLAHIGPSADGDLEGEVAITLIEAVEEYPA